MHLSCRDSELGAALALADAVDLAGAPVRAVVHGILRGPAVAVLCAAAQRAAHRNAMVALSLHESMRRGWLHRAKYADVTRRMWRFCRGHITADGGFEKVYVEWALPAELCVESSKTVKFGPLVRSAMAALSASCSRSPASSHTP